MWPFGKSTQQRLQEAIKENPVLTKYKIDARVAKKVAIFKGEVPRESLKNLLEMVAKGINGIESTDTSGVKVSAASSSAPVSATKIGKIAQSAPTEDPMAKAKAVWSKLKAEKSLANNPIDILQRGDVIILRGAVDSTDEFNKAKSLAASIAGVSAVDTSGLQVIAHASKLNVTDDDGDVIYTIKSGDTLSAIALHYYGSAAPGAYMKIANANGLADPNKIFVGQKLKIPGTVAGPDEKIA